MYDLVILGAGPAGLTAGIFAASRKLKALIIEADEAGGQLMSIYLGKSIANYPGIELLEGKKLAERLINHAKAAGLTSRNGPWKSLIQAIVSPSYPTRAPTLPRRSSSP